MRSPNRPLSPDALKREINDRVRELGGRLDASYDVEDCWGFICECAETECHERVPLSLPDYDDLRGQGEAVLARGHGSPVLAAKRGGLSRPRFLRSPARQDDVESVA
jgi:hypothetical protein